MSECKFKVGDVVKTRDGRKAEIVRADVKHSQPVIAIIARPGGLEDFVGTFSSDGFYHPDKSECHLDLMPPERKPEVANPVPMWVGILQGPVNDPIRLIVYSDGSVRGELT